MTEIFVTGAAGFIGGRVVRILRNRGDTVSAVIRDPDSEKGATLRAMGVRVVASDLGSVSAIRTAMGRADAVIHLAGSYRIGIQASERPDMYEANVGATQRVMDAAIDMAIPRIVHVSTVGIFGDTRGRIVDETFRRDPNDGFLSYYDETKYQAHQAIAAHVAARVPIVIAQPGTVYGPADHSGLGRQLKDAFDGTLPFIALGDIGISPAYVDDVAAGIVAALDRGRLGETYILAGQNMRLIDALDIVSRAGGRSLPRLKLPTAILRVGARLAPNGGRLVGQPPNTGEILRASDGVTYWASSAKAEAELGYRSRALDQGARDAFGPRRGPG
jgi:nucleoside-diphosphate-sugar epimerase